jgi:hypothetical protein
MTYSVDFVMLNPGYITLRDRQGDDMQHDIETKLNARIEALAARVAAQESALAELRARLSDDRAAESRMLSTRRDLLIGGAAIAAALMPAAAQADIRAKATTISNSNRTGAIGAPGADPNTLLPALGSTRHGLVGMADGKGLAPTQNSGVLGVGKKTVGVQGLSSRSMGVYGESANAGTAGVMAFNGAADGIALGAAATGNDGVAGQFQGDVRDHRQLAGHRRSRGLRNQVRGAAASGREPAARLLRGGA